MNQKIQRKKAGISTGYVMTIFIAFILAGALLPTAFSQIFNATTAGWDTSTVTVWILLPLMGCVALILSLMPGGKK